MDNEYSFQQMVIGKSDEHGHRYYTFQKRKNLKWIKGLILKCKIINLLG